MIELGVMILIHIGDVKNRCRLSSLLDECREKLDGQKNVANLIKDYGSIWNVIISSIILAGLYSSKFAPERALRHDWLIRLPCTETQIAYDESVLYPYIVAATLLQHNHACLIPK